MVDITKRSLYPCQVGGCMNIGDPVITQFFPDMQPDDRQPKWVCPDHRHTVVRVHALERREL